MIAIAEPKSSVARARRNRSESHSDAGVESPDLADIEQTLHSGSVL